MKKGLLKIKLAVYKDGRFHPKEYILKDREGNIVVGSGSGNHTGAGFERNWEKHRVATSWGFGSDYFYDDDEDFESDVEIFEKIWSGEEQDLDVRELDKDFATELLNNLGNPSETAVLETIAKEIYDAKDVIADNKIRNQLKQFEENGYGDFPICVAKTQYSFSTDSTLKGAPSGHSIPIREVRLSSGAEFIVVVCGEIMTMPGLPRVPAANSIHLNDNGEIEGLF